MNATAQLDELKTLLAQKVGLRIPPEMHDRFASTLHERAARLGLANLNEYRNYLDRNNTSEEWEEIVRAFTSVETFFFRDHGQFDLLRLRLLPELIARHRNDKTLRLWSAGCASGEEAYSLAILLDMLLPDYSEWNILILGTDIDSRAIAKAKHGCYGQWSFRMFPESLQQHYFHQDHNERLLDKRIRNRVTFQVGNLVGDPFPDSSRELRDMDLILCRNVFLYFDSTAVSTVATKFAATLAREGYLMTAHTELIGHKIEGLESRLFTEGVVYHREEQSAVYDSPRTPPAKTAARIAPALNIHDDKAQGKMVQEQRMQISPQEHDPSVALCASARAHADRGEYALAAQMCHDALAENPLAAAPYFLLAQLALIKGDVNRARECLNKTLYLDHRFVAAYLELAALCERDGKMPQAKALRRSALGIVSAMPKDQPIEQYEGTAGELAQWLEQWDPLTGSHGSPDGIHTGGTQHG